MRLIRLAIPCAVAALAFVTVATTLSFAPVRAEDAPAAGLDDAVAAFAEGRIEDCLGICEKIPADATDHVRATFLRAESLLLVDRIDDAILNFRAVVKERPKSSAAYEGLGRALDAAKKTTAAEEALRKAVDLDKKNPAAQRSLGIHLLAEQKYSDARTALNKAWKLDDTSVLTAVPLVDVELGFKAVKSALKIAHTLVRARPESPVGHFLLGRALEFDGEWKDAIAAYEASLARDDTYLDAHRNLAIVCQTQNPMYRDADLLDKSMQHYKRYFELGGNEPALRQVYDQMVAFLEYLKEQQK